MEGPRPTGEKRRDARSQSLGSSVFLLGLGSHEVVDDGGQEAHDADDQERPAGADLSQVAEADAQDGEVEVREGGGGEAKAGEDGHADGRQEGDEQAVHEGAGNAALHAAAGVTKDAGGSTAEEVRNNTGEDEGHGHEGGIDDAQDAEADDATYEGGEEADDHGVRSIGEGDRAVDGGDGARDQLGSDALEGGDDLANDQTHAGEDDVDAAGEGRAGGQGPHDPVGAGLGANVQQLVEVLELGGPRHPGCRGPRPRR